MGVCELIYLAKMFFFLPKKRVNNYSFLVLDSEGALNQLMFQWQKIRWNGSSFANGIIAITDNLEPSAQSACKCFANDKNILLCKLDEISEKLDLQGEF